MRTQLGEARGYTQSAGQCANGNAINSEGEERGRRGGGGGATTGDGTSLLRRHQIYEAVSKRSIVPRKIPDDQIGL